MTAIFLFLVLVREKCKVILFQLICLVSSEYFVMHIPGFLNIKLTTGFQHMKDEMNRTTSSKYTLGSSYQESRPIQHWMNNNYWVYKFSIWKNMIYIKIFSSSNHSTCIEILTQAKELIISLICTQINGWLSDLYNTIYKKLMKQ